jgi:GGDEF domain-containing protein
MVTLIERQLAACRRSQSPLAVLSVWIDAVDTGEAQPPPTELLPTVALEVGNRLRSRVRATDAVTWVGEREFAAVLGDASGDGARAAQRRLLRELGGSYRIDARLVSVTVSIGLAVYPSGGTDGPSLAHAARVSRTAG